MEGVRTGAARPSRGGTGGGGMDGGEEEVGEGSEPRRSNRGGTGGGVLAGLGLVTRDVAETGVPFSEFVPLVAGVTVAQDGEELVDPFDGGEATPEPAQFVSAGSPTPFEPLALFALGFGGGGGGTACFCTTAGLA